jgi:hypothetical protein
LRSEVLNYSFIYASYKRLVKNWRKLKQKEKQIPELKYNYSECFLTKIGGSNGKKKTLRK